MQYETANLVRVLPDGDGARSEVVPFFWLTKLSDVTLTQAKPFIVAEPASTELPTPIEPPVQQEKTAQAQQTQQAPETSTDSAAQGAPCQKRPASEADEPASTQTQIQATSNEETIRAALARRYVPGQTIELRCTKKPKGMIGGVYTDWEALVRDAVKVAAREDVMAVYTGLQQLRIEAAGFATNSYKDNIRDAGEASDIERYRWLLIDVDSVRFDATGAV